MKTLGTLGHAKGHGGHNWRTLEQHIVQWGRWRQQAPARSCIVVVKL